MVGVARSPARGLAIAGRGRYHSRPFFPLSLAGVGYGAEEEGLREVSEEVRRREGGRPYQARVRLELEASWGGPEIGRSRR